MEVKVESSRPHHFYPVKVTNLKTGATKVITAEEIAENYWTEFWRKDPGDFVESDRPSDYEKFSPKDPAKKITKKPKGEKNPRSVILGTCDVCGEDFEKKKGSRSKCSSPACYNARRQQIDKAKRLALLEYAPMRQCPSCAETFYQTRFKQVWCLNPCSTRKNRVLYLETIRVKEQAKRDRARLEKPTILKETP
jgi:hypothetical protein